MATKICAVCDVFKSRIRILELIVFVVYRERSWKKASQWSSVYTVDVMAVQHKILVCYKHFQTIRSNKSMVSFIHQVSYIICE